MSVGNIFISYRREDTSGHAGRLYDRLKERFPDRVVMDVASIDLGDDFVEEIERQLGACLVFIELIGHEWATITDQAGKRRLDQPRDFVRLEVGIALRRAITIIPILVEGATMPDPSSLPEEIAPLTRHNALAVTESDFDYDVARLVHRLETIFGSPGGFVLPRPSFPPPKKHHPGRIALFIGIGVAALFVLGVIGLLVLLVIVSPEPNTGENSNANTIAESATDAPINAKKPTIDTFVPPADTVRFVSSRAALNGELAEHYVDFSFYYPKTWFVDPKGGVPGASYFSKVERKLTPDSTHVQENFVVFWYSSAGTPSAEFPALVEKVSSQNEKSFSEYHKVSEGKTRVGMYDGYEFRFESMVRNTERGDIKIWGRIIFLQPPDGGKNGVRLDMLATSLAPEVRGVDDVGIKGETPVILKSFRLGVIR